MEKDFHIQRTSFSRSYMWPFLPHGHSPASPRILSRSHRPSIGKPLFPLSKPRAYLAVLYHDLFFIFGLVKMRKALRRWQENIAGFTGRGIIFKETGITSLSQRRSLDFCCGIVRLPRFPCPCPIIPPFLYQSPDFVIVWSLVMRFQLSLEQHSPYKQVLDLKLFSDL